MGSCWRWCSSLQARERGDGGRGGKVRHKTTRANRSPELSVPQAAHGMAPDVGSGILSFLLLSGNVQVLSGRVSSFRFMTTRRVHSDGARLAGDPLPNVFSTADPSKTHTPGPHSATSITSKTKGFNPRCYWF